MIAERERLKPPARGSAITIRLSEQERRLLEAYAVKHDLRFTQVIRAWIRQGLPVVDTGTQAANAKVDGA